MGPWPDGSRRFKRPIHVSPSYIDGFKYYAFGADGTTSVTDSNGGYKWKSILSLKRLLTAHPNAVELFPPELTVSEGL